MFNHKRLTIFVALYQQVVLYRIRIYIKRMYSHVHTLIVLRQYAQNIFNLAEINRKINKNFSPFNSAVKAIDNDYHDTNY